MDVRFIHVIINKMEKLTNIILPVYNRLEHTRQTLDSLFKNTPKDLFRLTVIDDKSDDGTYEYLIDVSKDYSFDLIKNAKNLGPGASRNRAHRLLNSERKRLKYIYQTDNDVYFKKGWLQTLISIYEKVSTQRVALLGASCHPYLKSIDTLEVDGYTVGTKDAVSGYSSLYTWEIWDRFGEFETQEGLEKKTGRSDDWAFCQKIKEGGFEVGSVEPELIIPCGKTDSYGDVATGPETFKEHEGIMVK